MIAQSSIFNKYFVLSEIKKKTYEFVKWLQSLIEWNFLDIYLKQNKILTTN